MENKISLIKDTSGDYFAGMTLRQAKLLGVDKKRMQRDFYNIDKNCDGILSANEIINDRKRSSRLAKISGVAALLAATVEALASTSSKKIMAVIMSVCAAALVASCFMATSIDKETKLYEKILKRERN